MFFEAKHGLRKCESYPNRKTCAQHGVVKSVLSMFTGCFCESAQHGVAKSVLSKCFFGRSLAGTNNLSSRATMSAGSAWPLVGGALVSHGSLVRVRPASDATSLSLLCSPSSRAEREFLAHVTVTAVQGWVLDFDQQSSAWHIFLFCFLRDVFSSL